MKPASGMQSRRAQMDKDSSIVELLAWLGAQLPGQFVVTDYWQPDLLATGISSIERTVLVYISTFGRPEGRYYLELETLQASQPDSPGEVIARHNSVTRDELLSIVTKHLGISVRPW
jgi:hypothetical protein